MNKKEIIDNAKRVKEYTFWLCNNKLNVDTSYEDVDELMMSFGWEYGGELEDEEI